MRRAGSWPARRCLAALADTTANDLGPCAARVAYGVLPHLGNLSSSRVSGRR